MVQNVCINLKGNDKLISYKVIYGMFPLIIIMHWPQFVTLAFYIPYKLNMVYIIYALQKKTTI